MPHSTLLKSKMPCSDALRLAELTLITSVYPKVLSKELSLDSNGTMVKISSANLAKGDASVKSIASLQEFADLLQQLTPNQALLYGIPKNGVKDAKIITTKEYKVTHQKTDYITRSSAHFEWPNGPGIMMFDYDPEDEVLTKQDVLNLLYSVCPEIKDVDHLWWTSSSSNIVNCQTGEHLSDVKGQRIYLMVDDASDIPRAAKVIEDRLWLNGDGNIKISVSGAMLERVPFDMCVYQPSRLDFAAGAFCKPPLEQQRGIPTLIKGQHQTLNTKKVLPTTNTDLNSQLIAKKTVLKAVAKPEADKKFNQYVSAITEKVSRFEDNLTEIEDEVKTAVEQKALPYFWPIHVWDGTDFSMVSVADILNNKFEYHHMLCLDPVEPDYDNKRIVARLFVNQSTPCIYSFARGGRAFKLMNVQYSMLLKGNLYDAVNRSIEVLAKRKEVFTYGASIVSPVSHKLANIDRPKMKHMLGAIFQYHTGKTDCDPSNELVDGICRIAAEKVVNPVKGIVDHPIIAPNLVMVTKQGYDPNMQLIAEFDYERFDVLDKRLSDTEVMLHLDRISAPFSGFAFESDADYTVAIAAVFSAVVRQVLPTCPVFGFDAPMQGSGKTLLAETIAMIATGQTASALAPGRADYDEEFRKRLFALLLRGEKVCLFDNIVGEFDSPSFAAAITSEYYEDRILQHSKTSKIFVKTLFLMTGNNLRFSGDMVRRVLRCRLVPKEKDLAKRCFKFDPAEQAKAHRDDIISSVLSLINHWKHCGQPKEDGTFTSFSEWDTLVRQPIAFLGKHYVGTRLLDVLDVSTKQQGDASDKETLLALLVALEQQFGNNKKFKAYKVLEYMRDHSSNSSLVDAILAFKRREELQSSSHVGKLFKQFVDLNVDDMVLRSKKISNSQSYWVERLNLPISPP